MLYGVIIHYRSININIYLINIFDFTVCPSPDSREWMLPSMLPRCSITLIKFNREFQMLLTSQMSI